MQHQTIKQERPVVFNTFADNMFRKLIREMITRVDSEESTLPKHEIHLFPELIGSLPAYQFTTFAGRERAWVVYKHDTMELVVWAGDIAHGPDHSYEEKKAAGLADGVNREMYGRRFVAPWDYWDLVVEWVLEYVLEGKVPVITENTFLERAADVVGYVLDEDDKLEEITGHTVDTGVAVDDPLNEETEAGGDQRLRKEEELLRKLHDQPVE